MNNDYQRSVSLRVSRRAERNNQNQQSEDVESGFFPTGKLSQDHPMKIIWKKGFLRLVLVGGILWMFLILTALVFHLFITEVERDYSRWVVKCQVNLRPLIKEFPKIDEGSNIHSIAYKVMFALEEERERDFAIVLAIPGRLVSYNLKYKTWDVLHDLGESIEINYQYACTFVDTLYPV